MNCLKLIDREVAEVGRSRSTMTLAQAFDKSFADVFVPLFPSGLVRDGTP